MTDTQKSYADMSESEKKKEDWMNSKWRPMMGWMYMIVCVCDFVLFPVMWGILHAVMHSANMSQWQPLTLQGAGLFHIAMGAVLGLAAWGRTQEKLGGANNGGISMPMGGPSTFGSAPTSFNSGSNSFSTPTPPRVGSTPAASFGSPRPAVGTSSCGRAMPMPQDDEVL